MSPDEKEPTEAAQPAEQEKQPAQPAGATVAAEPATESESAGVTAAGEPVGGPEPAEEPKAAATTAAAQPAQRQQAGTASRPERARPGAGERRRRYFGRRKVCTFCVEKARSIDYKDPTKLRRFLSDRGRIEARRKTGTCAKHQRWLALALKRARHLALLPYTPEHIRVTGMFAGRR